MLIITGGGGFIGSNLVASLEEKGLGPLVVSDIFGKDAKWRNLSRRTLGQIILPSDLLAFVEKNSKSVQGIFHLGANSTTTETDVDLILTQNFRFSVDLLDACTRHSIPFIYASSAATYGDGRFGFKDSEENQAQFTPLNPYAWSKLLFDRHVELRRKNHDPLPPQCVGLKFFNVYGPNEYHKGSQRSVVHQIFQSLQQGSQEAWLFKSYRTDYPDGGQKRDFIWVNDCVKIMQWFYQNPHLNGLYNVGTGEARSFNDLAKAIFQTLGQPAQIRYKEMPPDLPPQYQYFTEADMTKLRQAGYQAPFTSLEEGIRLYIQDYLMQENPYR